MVSSRNENRTVFTTEQGRVCPNCGKPISQCTCKNQKLKQMTKSDGIIRLRIDRKGRGGKSVTLIEGLVASEQELKELAKELKKVCGAGGAVKNGLIEIQGDVRDLLKEKLEQKGFKVKKAGG
ncbi:MAG TPA: translation initiation factor Sui1 [Anaerolineaceae bacterium]|nr:translation initiation factor Sui1 [Anaerolineaceae bacterium]